MYILEPRVPTTHGQATAAAHAALRRLQAAGGVPAGGGIRLGDVAPLTVSSYQAPAVIRDAPVIVSDDAIATQSALGPPLVSESGGGGAMAMVERYGVPVAAGLGGAVIGLLLARSISRR